MSQRAVIPLQGLRYVCIITFLSDVVGIIGTYFKVKLNPGFSTAFSIGIGAFLFSCIYYDF